METITCLACSCKLFIKARGLEDYVTGVGGQKPVANNLTAPQWSSLVVSCLINAMQPNIICGYLLLNIAWKMWSAAALTYSQIDNDAQTYELRKKVYETKQGETTTMQYYVEL